MYALLVVLFLFVVGAEAQLKAVPDEIPATRNFVLILADDMGVDLLDFYGVATSTPCTPHLSELAERSLVFRNAWANPICSPTRAQILTGVHAFRNGVGRTVFPTGTQSIGINPKIRSLPAVLSSYDSAVVGKWHLSDSTQSLSHAEEFGFGTFAGSLYNVDEEEIAPGVEGNYEEWVKTENGKQAVVHRYATTDTIDDAISQLGILEPPWFLYVSLNAPHLPAHVPPSVLCADPNRCNGSPFCDEKQTETREMVKAAVEAMDTEIGRLLAALQVVDPSAVVFFAGDNGTQRDVIEPPYDPSMAKGTLFQGGVHVPLMVSGPGIRSGQTEALVALVDLHATIAELAYENGARTVDSVSFAPVLFGLTDVSDRATVYAEKFRPNFDPMQASFVPSQHTRAVRNARFKLIRDTPPFGATTDMLFDLVVDPYEQDNLLPNPTGDAAAAYQQLQARLVELGVD